MSSPRPIEVEGGNREIRIMPGQKEPLLKTKLFLPSLRTNRVNRPALTERLNTGLDKALILISAPAGYGKTTSVSGWLQEAGISSAWISLDEGDNDPILFLQNFFTAVQKIVPTVDLKWLGSFQGGQQPPTNSILNLLINEVSGRSASFVCVLDDFHVIQAQPILDILTYLLEHEPPEMHLVLISRTDPPLPLYRLRARNQLLEVRAENLRFTTEEITAFLNGVMGFRLSSEEIAAMEVRTEGWVAGLQLAALSMQGCKDIGDFVAGFTGSHYYIMDYLTEEALKTQPEDVRSFLLQTSILNSMCASLCQSVVEIEGTESLDGQAMLEYLEKINLFVIPLDDKRQWYRYHHLFADVLNLRVEHLLPDLLPELHRRASRWYEENGIIPEAIQHALRAGDCSRAVELVEQNGCTLLMSGQGFTLLKWVEAVDAYAQEHPWLEILRAWALALTGNFNLVEPALQKAEGLFSPDPKTFEVEIMLGSIATVRAYLANIRGEAGQAVSYAKGALEYLPDGNTFSCSLRSVATSILGDASWMNGNLEEAKQAYLEAVRISEAASNIFMAMIGNSNLADVLVEQGELNQAARIFSETLKIATRPDGQKLPLADRLYTGLGEVFYEWNRLEEAAGYIQRCLELSRQWGNTNLLAKSYVMLARLELARCHQDKAQEALRIAEQLANEQRLSNPQSIRVKFSIARLWMAQGNLERAFLLVQQLGIKFEPTLSEAEIPNHRLPEYLFLVRLLLAQGDHEGALSLSKLLLSQAEASKQRLRVLETLILQALALQEKKEMEQAISVLEKAFFLAQPEGYIRVFLDEGEPLVKLLYQAKSHRFGQGYAAELMSEQGRFSEKGLLPVQPLIEPLTLREIEILRLIATGFTNQNIADHLVISIPTVKRHISNIYAKLGAKSRTQAVSLGRELRLVE